VALEAADVEVVACASAVLGVGSRYVQRTVARPARLEFQRFPPSAPRLGDGHRPSTGRDSDQLT
jgi:hypothetical protein